jgi:hypothetical protein
VPSAVCRSVWFERVPVMSPQTTPVIYEGVKFSQRDWLETYLNSCPSEAVVITTSDRSPMDCPDTDVR